MSPDSSLSLSFLLPFKLDGDTRAGSFQFQFDEQSTYEFYAPSIVFWVEVLGLVAVLGVVSAVTSIITYKYIILSSSFPRFLLGYGWMIPFWLLLPSFVIKILDVRNLVMKFCLCAITPTITIFHTTEAMHGFCPDYAKTSVRNYSLYCGSPMELTMTNQEKRYIKATLLDAVRHLLKFILWVIVLGVLHSLLEPSHYHPFGQRRATTDRWYSAGRLFDSSQLLNNLSYAVLFQMYLVCFSEGLLLATVVLTGKRAEPVMQNAVLKSTSPSDFWGTRWNTLIHHVLKRGVYLPVGISAACPKAIAVCATFLASGLFHEWLLYNVFLVVGHELDENGVCTDPACFDPVFYGSTAFFGWNALLILLERTQVGGQIFRSINQRFPRPLPSLRVIMLGLPVAHWFCESYIESQFFVHGGIGFPMIRRVS